MNSQALPRISIYIGLPMAVVMASAMIAHAFDTSWIAPGQPLSSSQLKADLDETQSRLAALQGQITTPSFATRSPSAFHAGVTKATTITGAPPIVFDHVDFDIAGEYNNVNGAFVAQNAGIYLVACNLFFTAGGTPATFGMAISKNGNSITLVDTQSGTSTSDGGGITLQAIATVQLAPGDTVACAGGDESGATRSLDTNNAARNTFSVTRVY